MRGTRRKRMILVVLVVIFFMPPLLGATVNAQEQLSDWPMFRQNPAHTGHSSASGPSQLSLMWDLNIGWTWSKYPVAADGRVYIGSFGSHVLCLDSNNGNEIWNYRVGSESIYSAAVVNEKLYIGSKEGLYCLNALNGSFVWRYQAGGLIDSSPTVVDDKVYIKSYDENIYCLDASTGEKIWSHTTGTRLQGSPTVANGKVYIGSWDQKLYCLDATNGNEIWSYTVVGDGVHLSSPVYFDEKIYFRAFYIRNPDDGFVGYVFCLDASDGSFVWEYETGNIYTTPAVADGKVYVGGAPYVYCLDATNGRVIWRYYFAGRSFSSPAVVDGKVYVSAPGSCVEWVCTEETRKSYIFCLDSANGREISRYMLDMVGASSPVVGDNKVYVAACYELICLGGLGFGKEDSPDWEGDIITVIVLDSFLAIGAIAAIGIAFFMKPRSSET